MSTQSLLLTAWPETWLSMTTDFAPLFLGLVVGVCLGVVALAVALGVYDTCWPRGKPSKAPAAASELAHAA